MNIDLFNYEKIKSFNELEMDVYNFVIKHTDKVTTMTIRELAAATLVSTTVILRFCKKLGCNGYSEFKVRLKMSLIDTSEAIEEKEISSIIDNLDKAQGEVTQQLLEDAASIICSAKTVIFMGEGKSGSVANYGSKHLTDMGKLCFSISDVTFIMPNDNHKETVLIIMSVSGESPVMIHQASNLKRLGATIISITNNSLSTIAKMSDLVLSYIVPSIEIARYDSFRIDGTTQVPAVFLLESLGMKVRQYLDAQNSK